MTDEIKEFLATYPADIQAICEKLRTMITAAKPKQWQEVLYATQQHIGYSLTGKMRDRAIYNCPLNSYVRLGFMRGTKLADQYHLMVGEGKWLRHVKVRTLEEADHIGIKVLIVEAWAYAVRGNR